MLLKKEYNSLYVNLESNYIAILCNGVNDNNSLVEGFKLCDNGYNDATGFDYILISRTDGTSSNYCQFTADNFIYYGFTLSGFDAIRLENLDNSVSMQINANTSYSSRFLTYIVSSVTTYWYNTDFKYFYKNYGSVNDDTKNYFKTCKDITYTGNYSNDINAETATLEIASATTFSNCFNLKEVTGIMLELTSFDMSEIFKNCKSLETIDIQGFHTNTDKTNKDMFKGCVSLKNVRGITSLKTDLDLSDCPLTRDSALVFLNALKLDNDVHTITFSKSTYALLTDDDKKIATKNRWTVKLAE